MGVMESEFERKGALKLVETLRSESEQLSGIEWLLKNLRDQSISLETDGLEYSVKVFLADKSLDVGKGEEDVVLEVTEVDFALARVSVHILNKCGDRLRVLSEDPGDLLLVSSQVREDSLLPDGISAPHTAWNRRSETLRKKRLHLTKARVRTEALSTEHLKAILVELLEQLRRAEARSVTQHPSFLELRVGALLELLGSVLTKLGGHEDRDEPQGHRRGEEPSPRDASPGDAILYRDGKQREYSEYEERALSETS